MVENENNRYGHLLDKYTDNYAKEEAKRRYGHLADKFDELEKKKQFEEAKLIVAISDTIEKVKKDRKRINDIMKKYLS